MFSDGDPLAAEAVDLDVRVTDDRVGGERALRFVLDSPNGVAGFCHREIRGKPFRRSPDEYHELLTAQIERVHQGDDLAADLVALGRSLYREIFPEELRAAYRRFRTRVRTLRIISDEPWIPWELIKPYDDTDPDDLVDDDFLCLEYQLTRWLTGEVGPPLAIRVARLACIDGDPSTAGSALPAAARERQLLAELATGGVVDASISGAGLAAVLELLSAGGVGLLHFAGHGEFASAMPGQSRIELADQPLRPRHLHGPVRTRLKRDRPLVFLNACRVARQGWALSGLGGWVAAWVRDGHCGAFIGPQWTVRDDLAHDFAVRFYAELRNGKTFGEATLAARRKISKAAPGDPTWLAYTIYAHPNGRLLL